MTVCSLLAKEGTDLKCGAAGAGASRSSAPGCGAGSLSLLQPPKCTWSWQEPCHSAPPTHLQEWAVVCMHEHAGACVEIESNSLTRFWGAGLETEGSAGLVHPGGSAAKSLQSCLTLCDPIDGSPPGSPTPGILQARTLEWVVLPNTKM